MEFRAFVTVPGIDVESDDAGRLLAALEQAGDYGPVLSGATEGVCVIVAADRTDEASAAKHLFGATADALRAVRLPLYPTAIEIEAAG